MSRCQRMAPWRMCTQVIRGEFGCITVTFGLVLVFFVATTTVNLKKSPTILTILDDTKIDLKELEQETLNVILLEQDNGETYVAFRINSKASLLKSIQNGRKAKRLAPMSKQSVSNTGVKPTANATVKVASTEAESPTQQPTDSNIPLTSFIRKPYLINNRNVCSGQKTLSFIVLVHTATDHFMRRSSIRETWANSKLFSNHTMRIVFLLGKPEKETTQTLIQHEQNLYHDMIQGDFIDSYRNLTLKGVLGLRWVTEFCPQARYIVKVDDDVFLNVFKLLEHIDGDFKNKTREIWCPVRKRGTSQIQRDKGKWVVADHEFRNMSHYPVTYCNGFFTILTGEMIPDMFRASKTTPFFWVDDVYLFGLLTDKIGGVHFTQLPNLNLNEKKAIECFEKTDKQCEMLVANAHTEGIMDKLWFRALDQYKALAKKYSKDTLFLKT